MTHSSTQPSLNRDFALLSLFIVFVLLMVSAWVTFDTYDNYEKEVVKKMESEALRLDRGLIVEIENASYILESLGRQIQATSAQAENVAQLFFSFTKSENPKRGIFSWVNKDQMITVSNNLGVLEKPIDVSDRDYVKKSIAEPWKVHIGRPIEGRLSHAWILPLSLGLTDKNGTYIGSVVVALNAESLGNEISRTLRDSGIHFAITNLSLTLLTQSPAAQKFYDNHFDIARLAEIDFDTTRAGEYSRASLLDSKQIYAYFERSSQYPYVIFLGMDAQQSVHDLRKLLAPRLFQLFVVALFLLFVLWTVRKRIIQPVIQLSEETAHILQGKEFDAARLRGPMEIQSLAHEISRLRDYIAERQRVESELRIKNTDLLRIKEAAQITNQVKADFFTYVGQELSEPAMAIYEQSETLKDQHFGPIGNPKYIAHATTMHEQAQQLLALLEEVKSISAAESGLLTLNETEVELGFILQKTIRIFRDQHPAIEVHGELQPAPTLLRGDELRLKQAILNILISIAPHVAGGETIRVHSSLRAQELSLHFSYKNISPAGGRKCGLGIILARLLISMHQGAIETKTLSDGITTLSIKFPALRVL